MNAPLLLRWSVGVQDTTSLSDFKDSEFYDLVWLCKLSIVSFQKWFPEATCILLFNGTDMGNFIELFDAVELELINEVEFVDQCQLLSVNLLENPYHFAPQGVWYKWIPFRYDIDCHEICIDTDIICVNEPLNWYEWIESTEEIIVAPERFSRILVNTCGDFYQHPVLDGRKPLNCGIVGQRSGCDYAERFFDITKEINYGYTHNSLFITEQGAINVWAYSLELEKVNHFVLDFEKCAWIRDFVYFLEKGVKVETVHATTWHKRIAKSFKSVLEEKVLRQIGDDVFLAGLLDSAKDLDYHSKYVIRRQIGNV